MSERQKVNLDMLYEAHAPALRAYLTTRLPVGCDPEDALQDVFLRALHGAAQYEERGYARAWLFAIARCRIIDLRRSAYSRRWAALPDSYPCPSPEDEVIHRNMLHWLRGQVEHGLTAQQYQVIRLRFLEGLSLDETATLLHMTIMGVKATQHRAINRIRRAL